MIFNKLAWDEMTMRLQNLRCTSQFTDDSVMIKWMFKSSLLARIITHCGISVKTQFRLMTN